MKVRKRRLPTRETDQAETMITLNGNKLLWKTKGRGQLERYRRENRLAVDTIRPTLA